MIDATDPVLKRQLTRHEGRRRDVYDDATGHTLRRKQILQGNLTTGIGWNLSARGLPDLVIDSLYLLCVQEVFAHLDQALPWWRGESPVRQRVLIDLGFNLGVAKLLTFHDTLDHWRNGEYAAAAGHLRRTPWFQQTKTRAETLTRMLETDLDPAEEGA